MEHKKIPRSPFRRLESLTLPLTLFAGLLPAVQPLILGQIPRFDAVFHLYRLAQLERALLHGQLFPRWLADLGLGYGFPLFNYYAPLSYYLALPLRLLGLSFEATLLGGFILGHAALVAGTYLWTRETFGKVAALGAAFLVGYAPYPLLNLHYRGAFAEVWGLAFLAWALWALQRLHQRGGRGAFIMAAAFTAALMLSHNVMALLGIPLLAGYALLLAWQQRQCRVPGWRLFAAIGLGLGLAAFFWIPALQEQPYVQIQQIQIYNYREHFLTPSELLSGPIPTIKGEVTPEVPHSIGWVLPVLALAGFLPHKKGGQSSARLQKWTLAVACLVLLVMTQAISNPVWERLPLLSFIQFPSRFLAPATLGLAVLAGLGLSQLPGPEIWRLPLGIAAAAIFSLTWLFMPAARPQPALTPPNLIRIELETGGLGTTVAGDYLPIWVQERPSDTLLPLYEEAAEYDYLIPRLDGSAVPQGARLLATDYGLTTARLTLETPTAFRARFHWYYFPGWQATLDGTPIPVTPEGAHGLLAVDIPAGEHTLEIRFGETPLRRTADAISLISVGALVIGALAIGKDKRAKNAGIWVASVKPHGIPLAQVLALCGIGLGLFAIKTLYLDHHDTLFHPWDFDGVQMRGVESPLQVRFGDDLVLMGYDLDSTALASDRSTALSLYWRSAQETQTNYSVGVHLINTQGMLFGQMDHQHPNNYPTSLLQPDEFIRDIYGFTPFAGTPPGEHYQMLITVYEEATGRPVNVYDSGGQWRGTAYPLTTVAVRRPTAFPAPETLPLVQRLEADLGEGLRLLGTGDVPANADVGSELLITLFWQAQTVLQGNATVHLELVDADGAVAAQSEGIPGRTDSPTVQWLAGEVIRDGHRFLIPAARADGAEHPLASGVYTLRAGLLDGDGRISDPTATLGAIAITAPERRFDTEACTPLAHIGGFAALLEATIAPETVSTGQMLTLDLTWRAETTVDYGYTVFVHLLNETGALIAQRDAIPVEGRRPTTGWFTGEIIADRYTVTVPPDTPPGLYTLKVGFYDPDTYARLPATDARGQGLGDGITWQIEVKK